MIVDPPRPRARPADNQHEARDPLVTNAPLDASTNPPRKSIENESVTALSADPDRSDTGGEKVDTEQQAAPNDHASQQENDTMCCCEDEVVGVPHRGKRNVTICARTQR